MHKVPYDLQLIVERKLEPDEKIKWVGKPKKWRLLLKASPFIIFLAIFGGFCIYFGLGWLKNTYFSPTHDPEQPYLWLACIPMFFMGTGSLYFSGWLAYRCTQTVYAVTNKRAIIVFTPKKTESFRPRYLQSIKIKLHRDGTGDLIFARSIRHDGGAIRETEYGFNDIEDVDTAEALLRALAETYKAAENFIKKPL